MSAEEGNPSKLKVFAEAVFQQIVGWAVASLLLAIGLAGAVEWLTGTMPPIFWPLIAALVIFIITAPRSPARLRPVYPALVIQAGYLLTSLIGLFASGNTDPMAWAHVLALGVGLAWLAGRPGIQPVIALIVYQTITLLLNISSIAAQVSDGVPWMFLRFTVAPALMHSLALALLFLALHRLRRSQQEVALAV
jgi:hypothetical protein